MGSTRQLYQGEFKDDQKCGLGKDISYENVDMVGQPNERCTGGWKGCPGELQGHNIRESPTRGMWIEYKFWKQNSFAAGVNPINWRFRDRTYYTGTIRVLRQGNNCEGKGTLYNKKGEVKVARSTALTSVHTHSHIIMLPIRSFSTGSGRTSTRTGGRCRRCS